MYRINGINRIRNKKIGRYSYFSIEQIISVIFLIPKTVVQKFFLISSFLLLTSYFSFSQQASCPIQISLLTCSPGDDLYSTFGHSALRIIDSTTEQDIVYNYGTFSFDEPGFYTKFVRGKLLYYLSTEEFSSFKQAYESERRGMIEQVLNLSCSEKHKMVQLLRENLMGENKFYKYDFLFDNCTTRLRDLLEKAADSAVRFSQIVKEKTSFRDHIFEYMDYNDKQWIKLGMDILLGNTTDRIMSNREAMYLPDYLLKGFDSGMIGSKPVVEFTNQIIELPSEKQQKNIFTGPVFIFWVLLFGIVLMGLSKNDTIQNLLQRFDGLLFFITGFAGIMMLVMWFGTEHIVCRNNYNLLWAWPTHAVMAFFAGNKKGWVTRYFFIAAILYTLIFGAATWFVPQEFNKALTPVIILLIFRSIQNGK